MNFDQSSLTDQFLQAVQACMQSFTVEDEERNITEAVALQEKIERRLVALRAEVETLERAERSHAWRQVYYERKRMARLGIGRSGD